MHNFQKGDTLRYKGKDYLITSTDTYFSETVIATKGLGRFTYGYLTNLVDQGTYKFIKRTSSLYDIY